MTEHLESESATFESELKSGKAGLHNGEFYQGENRSRVLTTECGSVPLPCRAQLVFPRYGVDCMVTIYYTITIATLPSHVLDEYYI